MITGYQYEVTPAGGAAIFGTSAIDAVTVSGLANGVVHEVRVRAENSEGFGPWSVAVSGTPQGSLSVTATPYFDPGYRVGLSASWPAFPGASEYRVTHFRQDDCGFFSEVETTTSLTSTSGLHTNCGAPTSCYFKEATVEALNGSGGVMAVGSASICEIGNPDLDPPGAPTGLFVNPGEGHLTFNWEAPVDDGGALITGFQYEVTPTGGAAIFGTSAIDAVTVSGLANGVVHEVRVRAENSEGFGPWSVAVSGTPQGSLSVTATPYFDPGYRVGLSASWPAFPGATEYRITHFRQDDCSSATVTVTTTGLASASGLHGNCGAPTSCYFMEATVEALDTGGGVMALGSASICEIGNPPLDPPSAPEDLFVSGAVGSVSFNWAPPSDIGGSFITHYEYSVTPVGGSEILGTTILDSATVSGLVHSTTHIVKVRAYNSDGPGPWSLEGSGTTASP